MSAVRSVLALALLLIGVAELRTQDQSAPLRVHFVDVGQGDGILIQSPSGHNVVYDAGEDPTRMREYLASIGVTQVDLVIASHNHADHIGGLPQIIRDYRPPLYMDNGVPTTTQVYARVLETVAEAGSQLLEPTSQRITLGDAALQIVEPPKIVAWDQNDNSIGVVVEYGAFRLSLAGDAEPRQWSWLLTHQRDLLPRVQVHKSSHHGSNNGDTVAGFERLSPEAVVISVGNGNSYGHPNQETLQLYAARQATVYRTDRNGTVIVEAQRSGVYTVRVERGEGAKPPPAPTPAPSPTPAPTPAPTPSPTPTPTTFTLSGLVQDATDSSRLSGVAVRITDGPNANRSTTTDSAGSYSLASLQQSGLTVSFSRSGYNTLTRGVTLTQNTSLSVSLTRMLAPAPTPSPGRYRIGAVCRDGTLSSATGSGACSQHGGVACWRYSDGTCTNP